MKITGGVSTLSQCGYFTSKNIHLNSSQLSAALQRKPAFLYKKPQKSRVLKQYLKRASLNSLREEKATIHELKSVQCADIPTDLRKNKKYLAMYVG
jgi:hypothetical protein